MARIFILPLFFAILFIGCKKENPTAPVSPATGNGTLMMKIDRLNAPAGVETVTAYLYRSGSDTLSSSINIIADTAAVLEFNSVTVGYWQVRVDARSNTGQLLYTGQETLEVFANQVTNISLTLMPVSGNTGSVLIYVNWGTLPPGWVDNPTNPVLIPSYSQFDFGGTTQQVVFYDGTKYRMWYAGLVNSARSYMMYAESVDGRVWVKKNNGVPVFYPSENGWDNWGVCPGAVIYEGGIFKMYYLGAQGTYSNWQIGLALSTDGVHWERYSPEPIMGTTLNEWQIIPSSVVKVNSTYLLYYTLRNYPVYSINVATSQDGIHWERFGGNPIMTSSAQWEGAGIDEASVIFENDQFKMVYSNTSDYDAAFGFATSSDGFGWQKAVNNPFFKNTNTAGNWAVGSIAYPSYIKTPTEYRIYYSGFAQQSSVARVGYIRKPL